MTSPQPTLRTARLLLRPFTLADASRVAVLAGDREVAATTLRIPHPYDREMAAEWIGGLAEGHARGELTNFAITTAAEGLIGSIGLSLTLAHRRGELGYWIGKPYWGMGHVTEAAREVLRYGFESLDLRRIHAHHMTANPASGTVLKKLGMRHEGILRQHTRKWDQFHDVECYGILAEEFENGRRV